jgi:hypothetical protein
VTEYAHRLDIDSDGHASVSCLHEPDDPVWFCVDDKGAVTDEMCWVSTWAPEWAEFAADAVDGTGLIDVGWVDDSPEVVGFTPDVVD